MSVNTTLAELSTTPANNGPDGAVDPPSMLDDAIRYHGAFIAKIRDDYPLADALIRSDLAATSGAGLLGWLRSAVGAVATKLANWMQRRAPSVFDFMTDAQVADVQANTALVNVTVPMQAAIDAGVSLGTLPDGTYLIDTLFFPNSTSDAIPIGGKFVGSPKVIFQQNTANTALFRKTATAGRMYDWEIGPFCVKPKAGASSTLSAIFTSGMTNCTFNRTQGLSNGTTGFYALFDLAASPGLSYFNTFNNPTLIGTQGYTKCFHFNNNAAGDAFNANANTINTPAIYNNTGLVYGIDCNLSYATTINQPYIEANSTAIAIGMGVGTVVNGGALEANFVDLYYPAGIKPSHHTLVNGTCLTQAHTIDFGGTSAHIWLNVFEIATSPWINMGVGCKKIDMIDVVNVPSITVTQTAGAAGTISNTFSVTGTYDPFTRRCNMSGRVSFTPNATLPTSEVTFAAPAGWTLVSISASILHGGIPLLCRTSIANGCIFTPASAAIVNIDYFIEFNRT